MSRWKAQQETSHPSDKHTHTEKDYCQLVDFHNVIFVFRKLELSPEYERQRGSVLSAAAAVHQAMKLLPGLDAVGVGFVFHNGVGR